jgi:hypothetical protein
MACAKKLAEIYAQQLITTHAAVNQSATRDSNPALCGFGWYAHQNRFGLGIRCTTAPAESAPASVDSYLVGARPGIFEAATCRARIN